MSKDQTLKIRLSQEDRAQLEYVKRVLKQKSAAGTLRHLLQLAHRRLTDG